MPEYSIVGKRTPREESVPKVTGEAMFTVDIKLPGMLCGKLLASPHAHAKIVNIDTSKARKLKGVKAVVTGRDIPHRSMLKPNITVGAPLGSDVFGMASEKVRYIGDVIAAVAAVDEETAEEALGLIDVEYEILPALFDTEEAVKPGAIKIHDHSELNIPVKNFHEYGDVEKGFQESDYVREDTFRFPPVAYCHPEPQNAVASYDPISGTLTIWAAMQAFSAVRKQVADMLEIPWTKVRVIAPYVGGGFGGRLSTTFQCHFCAAVLSMKSGQPVKLVYNREDEFSTFWSAMHAVVVKLKTGVRKDGTFMAREATAIYDVGAYKDAIKGPTPQAYAAGLHMPYNIPNVKIEGIAVYTNKQPVGPYRGNGQYATVWSAELQMDLIARDLGLDPVKMRLANVVSANTVTPLGWRIGSNGLPECIKQVAKAIGWQGQGEKLPVGRGKGVSASFFNSGGGSGKPGAPLPGAVRINADGTADMMILGTDSGAGQYSTLKMMVAEELGIPLEKVNRMPADTDLFPNEVHPVAVTINVWGRAVRSAAISARQVLLEIVAGKMEANVNDLECKGGRIYVKGSPDKGMPFAEAAKIAVDSKGPIVGRGGTHHPAYDRYSAEEVRKRYISYSHPGTAPGFSFGAAGAEVEVDLETGAVRILHLAHAYDVGFAVNPLGVEGQLQGGGAMSIGRLLTEEIIHDNGQVMNPSYLNYKMFSAIDMPQIIPIIVETDGNDHAIFPYGAKELGMGALSACGSAVVSAINDAIGVMITEFPVTPERILRALESRK
jgi:CO/xanthine dehydrogenase Mo-binding subunit